MLMDDYLPTWDVRSSHSIEVDAPPADTYQAVRELDLGRSLPVTALFAVRTIPHLLTGKAKPQREITFDTLIESGFVILAEDPEREIVLGTVGRFWRPDSGIERIDPEGFKDFVQPGFAKAAMTFSVRETAPGKSVLGTETGLSARTPRPDGSSDSTGG